MEWILKPYSLQGGGTHTHDNKASVSSIRHELNNSFVGAACQGVLHAPFKLLLGRGRGGGQWWVFFARESTN